MKFLPIAYFTARRARKAMAPLLTTAHDLAAAPFEEESHLLKTIGLISAALGAVAVGLLVGREIRSRYKFNRRTPYDLYARSGEETDMEYSVGI